MHSEPKWAFWPVAVITLLLLALLLLVRRSHAGTAVLAAVMILVQLFDAVVGMMTADLMKTIGPAVLARVNAGVFFIPAKKIEVSPATPR